MHILTLLLPLLSSISIAAAATTTIAYLPVSPDTSTSKPIPFAILNSDASTTPHTYSIKSYTPPKSSSTTSILVRIGVLASDGKSITSSSTLTTSEVLRNEDGNGVIKLRLGKEGSIWGVSFAAGSVVEGDKEKKGNGKDKQFPTVQVLEESLEPKVFLGKPVELNAEGKIKEEVKEKTLLQKYWWVLAAMLVITLMTPGGDK